MKNIKIILAIIMAVICIASCNNDLPLEKDLEVDINKNELHLSTTLGDVISFTAANVEGNLNVTWDGVKEDVTVTSEFNKTSGKGKVTFKAVTDRCVVSDNWLTFTDDRGIQSASSFKIHTYINAQ